MSRFFSHAELACRGTNCCGGVVRLHSGFLEALDALRVEYGAPMALTSGCRCLAHNMNVGGHPRSLHVSDKEQHPGMQGTLAVDVRVSSAAEAHRLGMLAMNRGWSVGVPRGGFIHLDRRDFVNLPAGLFGY